METILIRHKSMKLAPCRVCGNEDSVFWKLPGAYWIQCTKCEAETSIEEDPDSALRKWRFVKYCKSVRPEILQHQENKAEGSKSVCASA